MNIVFATTVYPPDNGWGGIGTYFYHLSRGLVGLGHRVTVVCGFGDHPRESTDDGVRTLRLLDTRPSATVSLARQAAVILERLVATESMDVLECAEYEALGLEFQRARPDFPVVVKLHGDTEWCLLGSLPGWKKRLLSFHMPGKVAGAIRNERESVRRASMVISPSRGLMDDCLSRGWQLPAGAQVVPNPIAQEFRTCLPSDYAAKRVIWLGRLDLRKGADLLPAIVSQVWESVPEAEFHVIGQTLPRGRTTWAEWVQSRLGARRDQFVWHGGVSPQAVRDRMSGHSLAAFASTVENFPYTQMECMAKGMACVNASGGGAREMGISGESLINVRRTPSDIAAALVQLLNDAALRERIGHAAADHVRINYSAEKIAKEMISVYSAARNNRHGAAVQEGTPVAGMFGAR